MKSPKTYWALEKQKNTKHKTQKTKHVLRYDKQVQAIASSSSTRGGIRAFPGALFAGAALG